MTAYREPRDDAGAARARTEPHCRIQGGALPGRSQSAARGAAAVLVCLPRCREVSFSPLQAKVWEDTRAGREFTMGESLGLPPPVTPDGKWVVEATFEEPGTYVLRCFGRSLGDRRGCDGHRDPLTGGRRDPDRKTRRGRCLNIVTSRGRARCQGSALRVCAPRPLIPSMRSGSTITNTPPGRSAFLISASRRPG